MGQPRQNVNYHLKELERAGLVRKVGERRNGNFIEALFQSVAPTIVVSPRAAWADPRRAAALREQLSLEHLILVGERLGRDGAALLDRAAFDGEEIASTAVEADVHFADENERAGVHPRVPAVDRSLVAEVRRPGRDVVPRRARGVPERRRRRDADVTARMQKTFTVAVPPEPRGKRLPIRTSGRSGRRPSTRSKPRPGGRVHWTLPGIESSGRVEEADRPHRLRHIEFDGPHTGSEITVTFEAVGEGTRIVITHAGFGSAEHWDEWLEGTELGWSQAIADLIVYLRTGVPARRFVAETQSPGMTMTDTDAGVEVCTVASGGLADDAGLQAGDLLAARRRRSRLHDRRVVGADAGASRRHRAQRRICPGTRAVSRARHVDGLARLVTVHAAARSPMRQMSLHIAPSLATCEEES